MNELLTPQEMGMADRLAVQAGQSEGRDSFALMMAAGRAVAQVARGMFFADGPIAILCGPGNNGGDGYVAAQLLLEQGADVVCFSAQTPKPGTDAMRASVYYKGALAHLNEFSPDSFTGVIDALYGAGLARPLDGADLRIVGVVNASQLPVVAIDLPSGLSGETGKVLGDAIRATATVTFFRKKPGHLLQPGRGYCGVLHVADIGIPEQVLHQVGPQTFENGVNLWKDLIPALSIDAHKYSRGHVVAFSGPAHATGAARLAARAAARTGAGAVTLFSPADALAINAVHLTSIMLRQMTDARAVAQFVGERKVAAAVLGPGFGDLKLARELVHGLLGNRHGLKALILDADAITAFAGQSQQLLAAAGQSSARLILTPHEGEFARLFPDLAAQDDLSKLDKAREAARRTNAVIIYKGADTVIADPEGRAAINSNGTAHLATAGSGDVLSGMVCGLVAQGMPAFAAACAAVWLHADAARRFGRGMMAEDLIEQIPATWRFLERGQI